MLKRGKSNIYLECQSWLWETNYQPVIFDKSFCAELEEFVIEGISGNKFLINFF